MTDNERWSEFKKNNRIPNGMVNSNEIRTQRSNAWEAQQKVIDRLREEKKKMSDILIDDCKIFEMLDILIDDCKIFEWYTEIHYKKHGPCNEKYQRNKKQFEKIKSLIFSITGKPWEEIKC